MNIPVIGSAGGIFEILVPGLFLLLNLGGILCLYLFPYADSETKKLIAAAASNSVLALAIVVGFGYLIGVLLRLGSPDWPDRLSGWIVLRMASNVQQAKIRFKLYATEPFPYIAWLGELCKDRLPEEAQHFYDRVWAPRNCGENNKQFFNYCKVLINSADEKAATEVYAAESLTRYISGMFYALVIAFILIIGAVLAQWRQNGQILFGLFIFPAAYLLALGEIIWRFRAVRVKEVETVFITSFRNKELFQSPAKQASTLAERLAKLIGG